MEMEQIVKSENMREWINPKYLDLETIKKLKKAFPRKKPFPHHALRDFLVKERAEMFLEELGKQEFTYKKTDLYTFEQTSELHYLKSEFLRDFYKFFSSKELISYMEYLTNRDLRLNYIAMTAARYRKGHYLLIHKDREYGRKIAFILYLTTLEESDGGTLDLFSSKNNEADKVIKKIVPKFNKFTFFETSTNPFHAVPKLNLDKERLSISGWFYNKIIDKSNLGKK